MEWRADRWKGGRGIRAWRSKSGQWVAELPRRELATEGKSPAIRAALQAPAKAASGRTSGKYPRLAARQSGYPGLSARPRCIHRTPGGIHSCAGRAAPALCPKHSRSSDPRIFHHLGSPCTHIRTPYATPPPPIAQLSGLGRDNSRYFSTRLCPHH